MVVKRITDVIGSLVGLVIASPVVVLIALIIKLDSRGPIFYRGERTGRFGRPFRIFKFRTMTTDAERTGGPSTALNDPRLTRVGRRLRKYKLDELPQLINVLRGEMSLVGPRPQVKHYTDQYRGEEKEILTLRPGLTDYASIEFIDLDRILGDDNVDEKYRTEIEPRKNQLRLKYVRECSFATDVRLILITFARLLQIRRTWNIAS